MKLDPSTKAEAIMAILKPVVKFCLHESCTIQDLLYAAKNLFVETAAEELGRAKTKVNASRLSVLTGIQRYEVNRILNSEKETGAPSTSLLTRVMGLWRFDKRFLNKSGKAKVLTFRGENNEFKTLVESVSKNINPGTVLFELERSGAVTRTKRGVRLNLIMFTVEGDSKRGLDLLSKDLEALLQSVKENLFTQAEVPNLHIQTEYDSIYADDLPEVRRWIIERGKLFHRDVREVLSLHDRDVTPRAARPGQDQAEEVAKVLVTAFSLCSKP